MAKKPREFSQSTTSSAKTLASKAGSVTGKGKRKATSHISAAKKKKVKNVPNGDDADSSASDTPTRPEHDAAQAIRKRRPSVVDIDDDDDNSSVESDMPIRIENSDAELGKRTPVDFNE